MLRTYIHNIHDIHTETHVHCALKERKEETEKSKKKKEMTRTL